MKSDTVSVQNLFQDRRQYCVPFYQRAYVWTLEDQWEQLWDDILEKAEARIAGRKTTPHFLGAVVLDPQAREGLKGVDVLHIIDGQQRLTTLQFVLTSVLLALHKIGHAEFGTIVSECVRNGNPDTMRDANVERFKIWPTFRNRRDFTLAMDVASLEDLRAKFPAHFTQRGELRQIGMDHPPALAALWFFSNSFEKWLKSEAATDRRAEALILAILRDLKVVSIVLEADDDAQVIFETLNGRGAQLHATDLIRNFLFMRADREGADSESLYDSLWSPFETDYWSAEQRRGRLRKPRIEWLMHASLQAELRDEVDLGRLYFEYRRYASAGNPPPSAEKQLLTINEYATHYKQLIAGTGSTPIALFGQRIAAFDITTLHPLALLISCAPTSDSEKGEMLSYLVSYIVRRAVCGLTQKNYNNVFQTLLRQLAANGISSTSLQALLSALSGEATRWPDDGEFRAACVGAALYYGHLETPKIRAILIELEAALRKSSRSEERSLPNLDQLDVDHIMPRSWFTHWQLADGSASNYGESMEISGLQLAGETLSARQQAIADRQSAISRLGNGGTNDRTMANRWHRDAAQILA